MKKATKTAIWIINFTLFPTSWNDMDPKQRCYTQLQGYLNQSTFYHMIWYNCRGISLSIWIIILKKAFLLDKTLSFHGYFTSQPITPPQSYGYLKERYPWTLCLLVSLSCCLRPPRPHGSVALPKSSSARGILSLLICLGLHWRLEAITLLRLFFLF